jgi:hypothetical protein
MGKGGKKGGHKAKPKGSGEEKKASPRAMVAINTLPVVSLPPALTAAALTAAAEPPPFSFCLVFFCRARPTEVPLTPRASAPSSQFSDSA